MPRNLPARPNLEHLRAQAKTLLAQYRAGDPDALRILTEHVAPGQREYRLADAQLAIARQSGFAAWPGLARHVERLRSLEGKWAFRSLEIDGRQVPASMLGASSLLIDGDRFRMESPEAVYEGLFLIDVEQTPHHIDIDFVEGPEAGNRCEGLFELEDDRFRLCLGLVGSSRPQGFTTSPGSGHALEELVRVEHARPAGVDGGTPQPRPPAPPQAPAAALAGFDGPLTPSQQRLQGEWFAVEVVNDGVPVPKAYLAFGSRVQSGTETRVVFGGQTMVHAKTRYHEDASPVEVDYLNLSGPAAGALSLGLFRWDGDQAVFCLASPGAPRPTDFTSEKGSGRTLSRWKR